MQFKFVRGKNFKDFVKILDVTTNKDFEAYEVIKKTVGRKEYKPFLKTKSFNKTIESSYLFSEWYFPYQFYYDVVKALEGLNLIPKENLKLIDDPKETGFYSQITRESFDEWLKTIKVPSDISIDAEEYDYQRDSVFFAINEHIARVEIATSGGKTFMTYLFCKALFELIGMKKKILIIVPSQLLCKQLKSDFKHYDEENPSENRILLETIYAGSIRALDANVICGTYQSLSAYDKEYFDDFGVCVCDELHRAKAYSIRNEIYAKMTEAEYFFGMTGTFPEYKTLDYLHIVSMFGREVVHIGVSELIRRRVANPVNIKSIKIKYFHEKDKQVDSILELYEEFYSLCPEYEGELDLDNHSKMYYVEKYYYQHNEHRMNIIGNLINKFDENSIVFVDTVEYCDELYDFLVKKCPERHFEIIHGTVKNRDKIIEEMRNTPKNFVLIATYGTMSTGVSIKNLTNAYIVDGGKSTIRIKQSLGRLMRVLDDKHVSKIFDFYDDLRNSAFRKQSIERLKIYRKEGLNVENFEVKIHK